MLDLKNKKKELGELFRASEQRVKQLKDEITKIVFKQEQIKGQLVLIEELLKEEKK